MELTAREAEAHLQERLATLLRKQVTAVEPGPLHRGYPRSELTIRFTDDTELTVYAGWRNDGTAELAIELALPDEL